ncbi:MAG: sulfotransferase [Dokdonella sp.]
MSEHSETIIAEYTRRLAVGDYAAARNALLGALADGPQQDWLDCGRDLAMRRDLDGAVVVLSAAIVAYPDSAETALALAGVLWQTRQAAAAESVLRASLARHPVDVSATFLLARIFKEQARMSAATAVVVALLKHARQPTDIVIGAVELLDDCASKHAAARACEDEIAAGSTDPRVYAYAGMLDVQIGEFERARQRYLFALENDPRATDWQCANGLAACQRYDDAAHPDFALFRHYLDRPAQSPKARASLLFALGKAHDDVGEFEQAATCFRQANTIANDLGDWSRKNWRRAVEARLDSRPMPSRIESASDCVPVFIVGMPRSGTTLVAELLARHAGVCHRGELAWLPFLARQIALAGKPTAELLEKTAATYLTQLRQDDASARFYIDKQPLNFMHVDLIAALFPNARIVYCKRDGRDTALSIWMQYFAGSEHNFAYDFSNIAAVMNDSRRLMASAQAKYPDLIQTVHYEALARDPSATISTLAHWIGLARSDDQAQPRAGTSAISTASLWQARQPVHTRSLGRWQAYAPYLPELLKFPAD